MRLRSLVKPVIDRVVPPLARWYLRKPRRYRHDGLTLVVPPDVFHPGLFLSTRFMLAHLRRGPLLHGQKILEMGSGSGLLSIWCARAGGEVTALDISPAAVQATRDNARRNAVSLDVRPSDLFGAVAPQPFDLLIVNPPYYPRSATTDAEHAWFCGPEFEYFHGFFGQLTDYVAPDGQVKMVLSEDCALETIREIAAGQGWAMVELERRRRWAEWNYIFGCVREPRA